ncbi:MAG: hypothetical protein HKP41_01295 [Desulfobacterales bacterium]|nr:hypothetical protein [Desulfobacterales bacterium]
MRSKISRLLILLLSFALVSFGVAHAGGLVCIPGCPQCKPVVQLSCCETQPSMHQAAAAGHAGMQEKQHSVPECCHSQLCADLFFQVDEIAANAPATLDLARNASQSSIMENQLVSLPLKMLRSPRNSALAVSLYTRNCSLLI